MGLPRVFKAVEISPYFFGERGVDEPNTMGKPGRSPHPALLIFRLPAWGVNCA